MSEAKVWRIVLYLGILAAAGLFLFQVWGVLIPFILGLVIAYLIQPLVDKFVAIGLRRDRVVIVLYLLVVGGGLAIAFFLVPLFFDEIDSALRELPVYAQRINVLVDMINVKLNAGIHHVFGKKVQSVFLPFKADKFLEGWVTQLPQNIVGIAHVGMWIFIIPFVAFFALAQGGEWMDKLFDWTPSHYVEHLLGLLAEINATLGGYIRGSLLDSMCVGATAMVGLWFLGFDSPVLLGVLTGVLNIVPMAGPIIAGAIALLIAYFQGAAFSMLVGIFCLYVLVRLCDDFFFMPIVLGQNVNLHPIIIVFALLAGVQVGGFMGLLFAVPLAAILKVVLTVLLRSRRESLLTESYTVAS